MKITAIKTVVVNAEMRNWIFIKVETDQAELYGWGEATLEWKTRAVVGAVEDLAPLLVGRDPRDIEQAVRVMHKHGFWRMGVIGASAISGIEVALWDILGKALGVPVWRLLGGKTRDRVAVYTHLGLGDMRSVYETTQVAALVDAALAVVEKGYRAVKVVFIPYTHYTAPIRAVDHVAKLMQGLREAVGDDVEIMVDFHGRPASVAAALDYIRAIEPGRPLFAEEPVHFSGSETEEEEIESVGAWLNERSDDGLRPEEIGVFVRSEDQLERAEAAVEGAGLSYKILDERVEPASDHVSISTMHLAKGLEFRAVVVMACDDEVIPLQKRIETAADDSDLEEVYNTERHLLYVACTRARDNLLVSGVEPVSEFVVDLVGDGAIRTSRSAAFNLRA